MRRLDDSAQGSGALNELEGFSEVLAGRSLTMRERREMRFIVLKLVFDITKRASERRMKESTIVADYEVMQ